MNKVVSFFKKTLRVIGWLIFSILLLFIGIALLIQIPIIQTKLVHYAISFVSNKTHTKVELKSISISFPKSVALEGFYMEDENKDTLLYAGELKVNISFSDLLSNKIHVSSFALEDVNANLNRLENDSLFNYNFLIGAFSDTIKSKKNDAPKKSNWTFSIDNINLKNIRLHYDDNYGGMNVAGNLKQLELKMNKIDLGKSIYDMDKLFIDGLTGSVRINKSTKTSDKKSDGVLPTITANKIQISNTNIIYEDSVNKQSLLTSIHRCLLKDASINLQNQLVVLDNFSLSKSKIQFSQMDKVSTDTTTAVANTQSEKSNWQISIKSIALNDNALASLTINKPPIKNSFDASHLDYNNVILEATDFQYSSNKTEVSINKFSAIDQNNFSITEFETYFSMDPHSITTKNLKLKTKNSSIDADLSIQYKSLNAFVDSLPFMILNADLKNVRIQNSDIIYFSPELVKQDFFKSSKNSTTISGLVNGAINNLKGKNIAIRTGINTILKTDFIIKGLPSVKTAFFNFPNLKVNTGKKDIAMMAGSSIPENIEIPEDIRLQVAFDGQLNSFESTLDMSSTFGSANAFATIDKNENFRSKISITSFDLGSLLKNKELFGPVSLTAETNGHGLDSKTIKAKINVEVSQIYLKKYNYHHLNIDGTITGKEFEGKINLNDSNAIFDFDGLVNLNPNEEQYKFHFNLEGADLQKLNLTKDDIRIGLMAESDLKGGSVNKLNGKAGISKIILTHDGKKYTLDSVLFASINEPHKSELSVNSALIGIKYNGTFSPVDISKELNKYMNTYFSFSDTNQIEKTTDPQHFNFEVQLHNHPILSEVFFPQLKEFEPALIQGSFDSEKKELKLIAAMPKTVYGTTEISNLALDVNGDANALNYKISSSTISNSQIKFDNLIVDGKLADEKLNVNISSIDFAQNKKLMIRSQVVKDVANYKLTLDPTDFYLMNDRWNIATDNYIKFGKKGFLIHHLFINKTESEINIASVHNQFNDDLNIAIKNFKLEDISGILEKDTSLVKGNVDGNVLLKRVNNTYGLIADAKISNLFVREVAIGDLSVKAKNPTAEKFDIDVKLSGADNNLTANGFLISKANNNSISIKTDIQSLSLKTVEAFSMGQITNASGNVSGNFLIEGTTASPDITGELTFNNAFLTPAFFNNQIQLKKETIQLKKDGIYFHSFTMLDKDQQPAIIDGSIQMQHFTDFIFALNVNTQNFLLFNTTEKDNKEYYGRMIIDSKMEVNGPMALPIVNARVKLKKGSNFTFAVTEQKLTTDKGEDVVEFEDPFERNSILSRDNKKEIVKTRLKGFDLASIIEIDKEATLRLLMDPASTDSLVVKGEAALNFTMDQSGKMSLTGAYNLNDGSYLVSLESVIKRKFDIDAGSTIIWNGDPLDAAISINATYSVRASPIDLVADQMVGLSESDKNGYKQRYSFQILLKLRGEILHPEISFEIQLAPEDKGILGGAVNAKLNMLNEDPSALNKQVFALLVLGRFIQENPLATETNSAENAVRTTVGKFLSAQLNQLSAKVVPGVELNFDVQSYDGYQSGQAQGRTQVDIGVRKQLFNERLEVQIGGSVDVEGEKAQQNSASDITSDVTVEYKLTKDGRYLLKVFRHNQYEGAIGGQFVETGVGVVYVRDFNEWKEFVLSPAKQKAAVENKISNDTINTK